MTDRQSLLDARMGVAPVAGAPMLPPGYPQHTHAVQHAQHQPPQLQQHLPSSGRVSPQLSQQQQQLLVQHHQQQLQQQQQQQQQLASQRAHSPAMGAPLHSQHQVQPAGSIAAAAPHQASSASHTATPAVAAPAAATAPLATAAPASVPPPQNVHLADVHASVLRHSFDAFFKDLNALVAQCVAQAGASPDGDLQQQLQQQQQQSEEAALKSLYSSYMSLEMATDQVGLFLTDCETRLMLEAREPAVEPQHIARQQALHAATAAANVQTPANAAPVQPLPPQVAFLRAQLDLLQQRADAAAAAANGSNPSAGAAGAFDENGAPLTSSSGQFLSPHASRPSPSSSSAALLTPPSSSHIVTLSPSLASPQMLTPTQPPQPVLSPAQADNVMHDG